MSRYTGLDRIFTVITSAGLTGVGYTICNAAEIFEFWG